ncbi:Wall-associated receptor kinase [Trichinella pseudospiralis]
MTPPICGDIAERKTTRRIWRAEVALFPSWQLEAFGIQDPRGFSWMRVRSHRSKDLQQFNPCLDEDGIRRVGGRLAQELPLSCLRRSEITFYSLMNAIRAIRQQ